MGKIFSQPPRWLFTLIFLPNLLNLAVAEALPGLRHHWNFDEGPDWHDDAFGALSTATLAEDAVGGIDWTFDQLDGNAWVSGRQYSGLLLDGIDGTLTTQGDLGSVLGGDVSLSFWLRTTQVGDANPLQAPGLVGSHEIQWAWLDATGKIGIALDGVPLVRSTQAVNDNKWHHIVLSRDSTSGELLVWVDGMQVASATGPTGTRTALINRLGRMQTGSSPSPLSARLDQIHLFDRIIDASTVAILGENHAPKSWPVRCDGETGSTFATPSVLVSNFIYDAERDSMEVASFEQPAHGTITLNNDASFQFTPVTGFTGEDSFKVWIHDGRGGYRKTSVEVQVTQGPDPNGDKRTTTFINLQNIEPDGLPMGLTGHRTPRAVDWDSDGDLDLLVGHSSGIWYYENTGTSELPSFTSGMRVQAAGADIALSGGMQIAWSDMDGDKREDLVVVDNSRQVRWYRNTASPNEPVVLAAAQIISTSEGGNFTLPDWRFDAVDWNQDALTDLIMGNRNGECRFYPNTGSAEVPSFDPANYVVLNSGAYNLYPRVFDLNRNGSLDYVQGINWGDISYWFDAAPSSGLGGRSGRLTVKDAQGAEVNIRGFTDGAVVDFADLNGDGVLDILIGGHTSSDGIRLAYGEALSPAQSIARIEAIYDAYPTGLGAALDADSQALLGQINAEHANLLMHIAASTLSARKTIFDQLVAHVGKYPFLQMSEPVDTTEYNHIPSIAGQNLMTLHEILPDTPTHRKAVADAVGLTGAHRETYLEMGLHVGDNQQASLGQIEAVRDFMRWQPRESFPDALLTLNHYFGNGRGGTVSSFRGAKNTFSSDTGNNASEWAGDLGTAINGFFGEPVQRGDYFTLVMAHEVTHSLDAYVSGRANKDLWRRKGQVLTLAAGPDVVSAAGDNRDWYNWDATRAKFLEAGHWDGDSATWDQAWTDYWSTGPGANFRSLSFMRGSIDWFLGAPQEAMATQANHHWPHSEGRIIAAIDRWKRGEASGNEPMKANLTEVITFLDWISCGMNKLVMHDNRGVQDPYPRSEFNIYHAWLERDERGYITGLDIDGRSYQFDVDQSGIVAGIQLAPPQTQPDTVDAIQNASQLIYPLDNDQLNGNSQALSTFTQPANGTVTATTGARLIYTPNEDFTGLDEFTYLPTGGTSETKVRVHVHAVAENQTGILMETWTGIAGNPVANLTSHPNFPANPNTSELRSEFAAPADRGSSFGTRMSALLIPPTTGTYTFWIASDDNGELWLGENRSPTSRRMIASVAEWSGDREWNKFESQQSSPIELVGGQIYYIEALQKEGGGGDNLAVAWQGPGISQEVIGSAYLRTIDYHAPQLNDAPNSLDLVENAAALNLSLAGLFKDADIGDEITLELVSNDRPDLVLATLVGQELELTPLADQSGSGSMTLRATDLGGSSTSISLPFTVAADHDGDGDPDASDPDDDNDGIPDAWEITRGLQALVDDAAIDSDGDRWSNWEEFLADTDPTDSDAAPNLRIALNIASGEPMLEFDSSSGREYQVEFRDSLSSGDWQRLGQRTQGNGQTMSIADPAANTLRFYRLKISLPQEP